MLITALATAVLDLSSLLLVAACWGAFAAWNWRRSVLSTFIQRIHSLRWFLLALLLLHGAGAVLAPEAARGELMLGGLRQVLVLLLLLFAVTLVLEPLSVPERIRAFSRLLAPLRFIGIAPERIGRMLTLALEEAFSLRENLQTGVYETEQHAGMSRSQRLVDTVARRCLAIENSALD